MSETFAKKVMKIVLRIFTWCVAAFAVLMMIFTLVSVTTLDRNNRSIFGFKLFIDLTDSMSPDYFSAGDIVIVKNVKDMASIKAGDIITYQSLMEGETYGQPITHMVRSAVKNTRGGYEFVTYGVATGVNDALTVSEDFVLGKYVGRIPNLGYFFQYLRTPAGYIICILIPFLILIGMQGMNCVKVFKKYKREQLEQLDAEKAQIEAERAESQRMLAELTALKAQLEQQNNPQKPSETNDEKGEEANR